MLQTDSSLGEYIISITDTNMRYETLSCFLFLSLSRCIMGSVVFNSLQFGFPTECIWIIS